MRRGSFGRLCVACVFLAGLAGLAWADFTQFSGNSGTPGATSSRVGIAFPHVVMVKADSNSTTANQYTGDTPNAAAYLDTIRVARDFNGDSVTDSVGVSNDYASVRMLQIEYVGTGPDTLWVKGLDDQANTIWLRRIITPTTTNRSLSVFAPVVAWAERVVVFAGRATASSDEWMLTSYHERR